MSSPRKLKRSSDMVMVASFCVQNYNYPRKMEKRKNGFGRMKKTMKRLRREKNV